MTCTINFSLWATKSVEIMYSGRMSVRYLYEQCKLPIEQVVNCIEGELYAGNKTVICKQELSFSQYTIHFP